MPEHDASDIVDQIDHLTDDAATWSKSGADDLSQWNDLPPGVMAAILLDVTRGGKIKISRADPVPDLVRLVGDPLIDRITPLDAVQVWVGKNSVAAAPANQGATRFLHDLLSDVRDGHYLASDTERETVRTLLDGPDGPLTIHGSCVITGATDIGEPGPLGENFHTWYTATVNEINDQHAMIRAARAVAAALGLPVEGIIILPHGLL